MAAITPALVKDLREKTGAGMMDCQKALKETDGDLEKAVDWLRKKGLSSAAKKSGRTAAEGLVGVAVSGTTGAVVEVNSETDFVARNEAFQEFVERSAQVALAARSADAEALKAQPFPGAGHTVADELVARIATVGENLVLRRAKTLSVTSGLIGSYVHQKQKDGLGRIGVLVALESEADPAALAETAKQLAMHIASARPEVMDVADVDPADLERERLLQIEMARKAAVEKDVEKQFSVREDGTLLHNGEETDHERKRRFLAEQVEALKDTPKYIELADRAVEGRIRKQYMEQYVLLEQVFIVDGKTKIRALVEQLGKQVGKPVALTGWVRYGLGEGIEKQVTDFAAEVAAAAR